VELAPRLRQTGKEDVTQTAHVQTGCSLKLKLANVVLDDGTTILQKQLTSLDIHVKYEIDVMTEC